MPRNLDLERFDLGPDDDRVHGQYLTPEEHRVRNLYSGIRQRAADESAAARVRKAAEEAQHSSLLGRFQRYHQEQSGSQQLHTGEKPPGSPQDGDSPDTGTQAAPGEKAPQEGQEGPPGPPEDMEGYVIRPPEEPIDLRGPAGQAGDAVLYHMVKAGESLLQLPADVEQAVTGAKGLLYEVPDLNEMLGNPTPKAGTIDTIGRLGAALYVWGKLDSLARKVPGMQLGRTKTEKVTGGLARGAAVEMAVSTGLSDFREDGVAHLMNQVPILEPLVPDILDRPYDPAATNMENRVNRFVSDTPLVAVSGGAEGIGDLFTKVAAARRAGRGEGGLPDEQAQAAREQTDEAIVDMHVAVEEALTTPPRAEGMPPERGDFVDEADPDAAYDRALKVWSDQRKMDPQRVEPEPHPDDFMGEPNPDLAYGEALDAWKAKYPPEVRELAKVGKMPEGPKSVEGLRKTAKLAAHLDRVLEGAGDLKAPVRINLMGVEPIQVKHLAKVVREDPELGVGKLLQGNPEVSPQDVYKTLVARLGRATSEIEESIATIRGRGEHWRVESLRKVDEATTIPKEEPLTGLQQQARRSEADARRSLEDWAALPDSPYRAGTALLKTQKAVDDAKAAASEANVVVRELAGMEAARLKPQTPLRQMLEPSPEGAGKRYVEDRIETPEDVVAAMPEDAGRSAIDADLYRMRPEAQPILPAKPQHSAGLARDGSLPPTIRWEDITEVEDFGNLIQAIGARSKDVSTESDAARASLTKLLDDTKVMGRAPELRPDVDPQAALRTAHALTDSYRSMSVMAGKSYGPTQARMGLLRSTKRMLAFRLYLQGREKEAAQLLKQARESYGLTHGADRKVALRHEMDAMRRSGGATDFQAYAGGVNTMEDVAGVMRAVSLSAPNVLSRGLRNWHTMRVANTLAGWATQVVVFMGNVTQPVLTLPARWVGDVLGGRPVEGTQEMIAAVIGHLHGVPQGLRIAWDDAKVAATGVEPRVLGREELAKLPADRVRKEVARTDRMWLRRQNALHTKREDVEFAGVTNIGNALNGVERPEGVWNTLLHGIEGVVLPTLGRALRLPAALIQAHDQVFKTSSWYSETWRRAARESMARSKAGQEGSTFGIAREWLSDMRNIPEDVNFDAAKRAQMNTFNNELEGWTANLEKKINWGPEYGMPARAAVMFYRTLVNERARSLEFFTGPLAAVPVLRHLTTKEAQKAWQAGVTSPEWREMMGRAAVGYSLIYWATEQMSSGRIAPSYPGQPEMAATARQLRPEDKVLVSIPGIGDKWLAMRDMGAVGLALKITSTAGQAMAVLRDPTEARPAEALIKVASHSIGEMLVHDTWGRGLLDFFEAFSSMDEAPDRMIRWMRRNLADTTIPWIAQLKGYERAFEGGTRPMTKRQQPAGSTTEGVLEKAWEEWDSFSTELKRNLAFWDTGEARYPQLDLFGNPQTEVPGYGTKYSEELGYLPQPDTGDQAYATNYPGHPVAEAILELRVALPYRPRAAVMQVPGAGTAMHEYSAKQLYFVHRTGGRYFESRARQLLKSDDWQQASIAHKRKLMRQVYMGAFKDAQADAMVQWPEIHDSLQADAQQVIERYAAR